VAANGTRAANGNAADRVSLRIIARRTRTPRGRLPPSIGRTGYVEDKNVATSYRWAEGQYDRLPALAADLASSGVSVIAATDGPSALAAKGATTTIPVVFITGIEPLQVGLVARLDRPEGNLTGVNLIAGPLPAKQLGLLHELIPRATTIALLVNPNNPNSAQNTPILQEAAREIGAKIHPALAATESDLPKIFAAFAQERVDALIVSSDVFFTSRRDLLIALASRYSLPSIYHWREFAVAGGLMSYGPSLVAAAHQIGVYTAKILSGAKPVDLPVTQPTKFEFVVNLKTAKALQLKFPAGLLAIADEVIE
jgi:putative ABC transport system substrate-binding protein